MSLCGDVNAAGIRMPLHRFAGTIRRNKHRDDRAHGRLQNPLAQNDVRAGEPSRRWEARWKKWKGQARSSPCHSARSPFYGSACVCPEAGQNAIAQPSLVHDDSVEVGRPQGHLLHHIRSKPLEGNTGPHGYRL